MRREEDWSSPGWTGEAGWCRSPLPPAGKPFLYLKFHCNADPQNLLNKPPLLVNTLIKQSLERIQETWWKSLVGKR